jgi:hypothetical protein
MTSVALAAFAGERIGKVEDILVGVGECWIVGAGVKVGVDGITAGVVVGSGGVAIQAARMNRNAKKTET